MSFEQLARTPAIGHRREDLTTADVLFWLVGNYLVIYRALASKPLEIVTVVQGNHNIPAFLRQRSGKERKDRSRHER